MNALPPVLEMRGVSKNYSGLRPLRVAELTVAPGERVTVGGIDAGAGELLVNLVTGASVPDAGEIRIFGQRTADIPDGDAWLDLLERFGIVSPRAVLLEGSTLQQNLAMPFTLEIDPVPAPIAARVESLAAEWGSIRSVGWARERGTCRLRSACSRISRAPSPSIPDFIVVEHPTADVAPAARDGLARAVARACESRRVAALVLTNDEAFAKAVAPRNLKLDGATGVLKTVKKGWFG